MLAVVFPGQGSQAPGMGKALFDAGGSAREVFETVSSALGFDVAELCFASDEETLRQTQNAQVALYTVGLAAYRSLLETAPDLPIKAAAGHSVGEYAALAAAGVFDVAEGAKLVRARGETMAEAGKARPGTMAAVLGLDREVVEKACSEVDGVCVLANDNCPGQLVISGDVSAVAKAGEVLKELGAKRVLPLNVSGAFHSPLMEESSKVMAGHLANASIGEAAFPVYSNVTSEPGSGWSNLLEEQLRSPVRWAETVQHMTRDGVTTFIECGHGAVLTGLLKRIAPDCTGLTVSDPAQVQAAIDAVKEKNS